MFLTRLWLLLLAAVGAAAVVFGLVVTKPLGAQLVAERNARLSRAETATALLLRANARSWIDGAAQTANDAVLMESLVEASRGGGDAAMLHKTAGDRLRKVVENLKADLALAVDAKGRVLARIGPDEAAWKDQIDGLPPIGDALRGLRGDDVWSMDGKLWRVAASPVISRDKYVGAIVVGQEMGRELALSMKQALDTDVAFVLRGRVVASTLGNGESAALAQLPVAVDEAVARGGKRQPATLGQGDGALQAVVGLLPGQAAGHKAAVALLAPAPKVANPLALVGDVLKAGVGALPIPVWGMIGGGLFVVILIGWILAGAEGIRPLRKLALEAQRVGRGEEIRFDANRHGGRAGVVARAVNSALDRLAPRTTLKNDGRELPVAATKPPPSIIDELIPPAPAPTPASKPDFNPLAPKPAPRPTGPSTLALDDTLPPPVTPSLTPPLTAPPPVSLPVRAPAPPPRQLTAPAGGMLTASLDSLDSLDSVDSPLLTPLPPNSPLPAYGSTNPGFGHEMDAVSPLDLPDEVTKPPTTAAAAALSTFLDEPTRAAPDEALAELARADFQAASLEVPTNPHAVSPEEEALQAELESVFRDFYETKKSLGESTDGVTMDKFIEKLRDNRQQLIEKFGCKEVRFQVYVKDGKAALKATPIQ